MSERPHFLSAADFDFDALQRNVDQLRADSSIPLARPAEAEASLPAGSYARAGTASRQPPNSVPQTYRHEQQPDPIPFPFPASENAAAITLGKAGDYLELDFRRLFIWLRAGLVTILMLSLLGALAGAGYGLLAKRRFTVATDIMINPVNLRVMDDDLYAQSGQVDSQVLRSRSKQRVLTSRNVLSRVVDNLHLADDPEFAPRATAADDARDPKLTALAKLQDSVRINADDQSFVTTLLVSSESADKAIEISQAIVKMFQDELARTEAEGASRAATALDRRLAQLKEAVLEAEKKVQTYRRDHNLSSSNGQLVSSQAMTELNIQIVQAQARASAAQANYDTLVNDGIDGANANTANWPTLAELRIKADKVRQDLNALSVQLGPRHPSILRLQAELDTTAAQVKAEYRHVVEVAKASRDAAKSALDALTANMDNLQGNVFSDNESEVVLRELERDAASKTAIYQSSLLRARQIAEQEQIDTTNVQVISAAVPPKGRSWPPSIRLLLVLGAFGGLVLGILLALARGIRHDLRPPADDMRGNPV